MHERVRQDYAAGLITIEEARTVIGYSGPVPLELTLPPAQPSDEEDEEDDEEEQDDSEEEQEEEDDDNGD